MHTVEKICGKIEILNSENIFNHTIKNLTKAINGIYQTPNFVYIDSIKNILNNLSKKDESSGDLKLLKFLLSVH
jgi:hypothetical protein